MDFIQTLHSHNKYLVAIIALLLLAKLLVAFFQKSKWSRMDNALLSMYNMIMTLQLLLGLILIISKGFDMTTTRFRMEHGFVMLIAVGLGHYVSKFKRIDQVERVKKTLIFVLLSIACVLIGLYRVPNGMNF